MDHWTIKKEDIAPKSDISDLAKVIEPDNTEAEIKTARTRMRFWIWAGAVCLAGAALYSVYVMFLVSKTNLAKNPFGPGKTEEEAIGEAESKEPENLKERKIDGVMVREGAEDNFVLAVMIDNHPDARPASGLDKANLVIEAEAEGGITRFVAFFAGDEEIEKIGPVRSARPYYIDWAGELGALYAHVGGSPEALAKMSKEGALHINEFYNGSYFWRDHERLAPHNVYTSTAKLREYLAAKEIEQEGFMGWTFRDDPKTAASSSEIRIDFLLPDFHIAWKYEPEARAYARYNGQTAQTSAEGGRLEAKNIAIQYVRSEVLDEAKRQRFSHIGEGKAIMCSAGICEDGTWKKKGAEYRTKFYRQDGSEFVFVRGTTWIEVVDPGYEVEVVAGVD